MAPLPEEEREKLLPENVPVSMPELPLTLKVSTARQFKAVGDVTRLRILDIIKHQPFTAKQLGEKLNIPPGTAGHHLQVLEAAGLAQVVARRLVHGIVAKYYTRTARFYLFDFPKEMEAGAEQVPDLLAEAREQLADALITWGEQPSSLTGFPHARLSTERAEDFRKRLLDLVYEFATEPSDPAGQVYGCCVAFFLAPPYLQNNTLNASPASSEPEK